MEKFTVRFRNNLRRRYVPRDLSQLTNFSATPVTDVCPNPLQIIQRWDEGIARKGVNISKEIERAISIISEGDEGQLVLQVSKLANMDMSSCGEDCLDRLISNVVGTISGWSPEALDPAAKLFLNLRDHNYFSEAHANALLDELFTIVLSFPMDNSETAGDTVSRLGDLMQSLMSKCSFDEKEYLNIETYSRQVLEYDVPEKRRIFSMLYIGLLKSPTNQGLLERYAIPLLKSILDEGNEEIIRGDLVFILSMMMRDYPMNKRMKEIWPEIQDLWYYSASLGDSGLESSLATFLELFRNDHQLRSLSESIRVVVCELLIEMVQFVCKKSSGLASIMSTRDARFLKYFASSITSVFRVVRQIGNCQLKAEVFGSIHDLCGCYLNDVRMEIAKALPNITRSIFELKQIDCPSVSTAVSSGCFGGLVNFACAAPLARTICKEPSAKEFVHADRFYLTLVKLMEDKERTVRGEMLNGLSLVLNALSDYECSRAINVRLCNAVTHMIQFDGHEARKSVQDQVQVVSRIYSGHGTRVRQAGRIAVPSCSIWSIVAAYRK